jgi:hypothetical protein
MSLEITLDVIKKALKDLNFRQLYPELNKEMYEWIANPDCKCNVPLYNAILSDIKRLKSYFGDNIVVVEPLLPIEQDQINKWQVINCKVDELENVLKNISSLNYGPKQIACCRYQDDITVIINDPVFN